jgi:hypothetical protein
MALMTFGVPLPESESEFTSYPHYPHPTEAVSEQALAKLRVERRLHFIPTLPPRLPLHGGQVVRRSFVVQGYLAHKKLTLPITTVGP